jgi:hypothetical protein
MPEAVPRRDELEGSGPGTSPSERSTFGRLRSRLAELGGPGAGRFESLAVRFVRSPWLFVVLAALGPIFWGRPFGEFLYGQDSTRLIQPFAFNDSPFIPYSYLLSSVFPVPDYTTYFYLDATLRVLSVLSIPPWFAERLLLSLLAGLAAAGAVVLLRAVDAARDRPSVSTGWLVGLVALVYVYNPFTLSETFWHIEGWTLFLAFLPWLVALALRTVHDRRLPLRFAVVVTLLGIYVAPGIISSFAVPVAIVLIWAFIATWLTGLRRPFDWRRRLGKSAVLLGVAVGIEAWSFVPFLLVPDIAYTSNNYVTPANLFAVYAQASATSTPYAVVTLTAFSWLVRTPSAYPWAGWLPAIAAAAVIFPVVVLLGSLRLGRSRGALLVYAMGLSALPLMIGGIAPLTQVNTAFLRVGGPFLVLTGGYYFLGTVYLLVPLVGLHEIVRTAERRPVPASPGLPPATGGPRRRAAVVRPSVVVALVIAALLVASAFPFALGDVYQTSGPNADAVSVPPSYGALSTYFGTPPSGPDYYVLVLPMSAQAGQYLNLTGHQFLDTGNLLASYIPYPVLATNNGPTAAGLEEFLSEGTSNDLGLVLANLHIRYVVDNPFANRTAPTMNEAPNGAPIDYATIEGELPAALGPGVPVGAFTVYSVPEAVPLGWSTPELVGIDTPSDAGALSLIGSVNNAPPAWMAGLRTGLWAPNDSLPGWELTPTAVTLPVSNWTLPAGDAGTVVDDSGHWGSAPCASGACEVNGTSFRWSGASLTLEGPVERTTGRPGDYLPAPSVSGNGACTPSPGSVSFSSNGTVAGPAFVATNVTLDPSAPNNWANVDLTAGNLTLLLQAYQGTASPPDIGLAALYRGVPYVWHNTYLPLPLPTDVPWTMALDWNASNAFATLTAAGVTTSTRLSFGDVSTDGANPGFDAGAAPVGPVALTTANESISLIGAASCLDSASVSQLPDVSFLVAVGPGAPSSVPVGNSSSVTSDGDVVVSTAGGGDYVVLGYPFDGLWTATADGASGLTSVPGAPFANIFSVSSGSSAATVTFHFRTWLIVGLEASWAEVAGLVVLAIGLTVQARRRGRPPSVGLPPSTTDGPAMARPPARMP